MADPTNPPDPNNPVDPTTGLTVDQYNQLVTAQQQLTVAQSQGNDMTTLVKASFEALQTALTKAGASLNDLDSLTQQQTEQFALATTAVVKARDAFVNFSSVDYSGLSTFHDQLKDIQDALFSGGTAAAQAGEVVEKLANQFLSAGAKQDAINQAKAKGISIAQSLFSAVAKETQGMMTHADNMLRLQTAYVQMSARTGELGDNFNAAGGDLSNMNDVLQKQQELLKDTREATGLSAAQVERWYNQLGLVPGALRETVDLEEKGGRQTSLLTAVIQTATGSGREMSDVMKDLNIAFRDYGLVGEKALLFSTRMSDISTRLKAPIEDVTAALRGSADAFKMFATGQENASKAAESLANVLNVYGKALESTGLSASAAVEIAGNLSNQVSKLNTAQLSFISQQTGGPGGLLGAARETVRLQTDPGAVVADAMRTLQQQFGRIVTVQEAAESGSEAMAAQNVKQTLLLQQLLGPLAKDQASANRLLEAMRNQAEGQPNALADALKPTVVQETAQRGVELQAKSYGILTESRNILEEIRDIGDRGGASIASRLTAGSTNLPLSTFEGLLKTSLQNQMQAARERGGAQVAQTSRELATGSVSSTGGANAAADIHRALLSLNDIPLALRAHYEAIKSALSSGDKERVEAEEATLEQMIASQKQVLSQTAGNASAQAQASSALQGLTALSDATRAALNTQQPTASQRVGAAAGAAATQNTPGSGSTSPNASSRPTGQTTGVEGAGGQAGPASTINIVGRFSIDCPNCGRPHDVSPQASVYPAQFNR